MRRRPDQYQGTPGTPRGAGFPSSAVLRARLVIISGPTGGEFIYSPAPGPGNLVASAAPQNGTDPYGNTYVGPGFTVYGPAGQLLTMFLSGGNAEIAFESGSPTELLPPSLNEALLGSGAAEFIAFNIFGAQISLTGHKDVAFIQLNSPNFGGTSSANGSLAWSDTLAAIHTRAVWDSDSFRVFDADSGSTTWVPVINNLDTDATTTATTDSTILTTNVISGHKYAFEFDGNITTGSTNSMSIGIRSPVLSLAPKFRWIVDRGGVTPAAQQITPPGEGNPYAPGVASTSWCRMNGVLTPSANGSVAVTFKSGTSGQSAAVNAGAFLRVTRLA